jgi:hypothetical protein
VGRGLEDDRRRLEAARPRGLGSPGRALTLANCSGAAAHQCGFPYGSAEPPRGSSWSAQRGNGSNECCDLVDVFFDNLSLTLAERPLQATLSASRTCGAKPSVVASVRPGAGTSITSAAFSVGGKRTIDTSAPFSVKAPVAGKPKKIAVAAVATDSAGRTATLKKSVKGC